MESISIIAESYEGEKIRIGDYLLGRIPVLSSRKSIKKAIARGHISLNNKRAYSYMYVIPGDIIDFKIHQPKYTEQLVLDVAYEDEGMAVVVKPPGVLSSGHGKVSIAKSVVSCLAPSPCTDRLPVPLLLHRLDRDTSGLLLVAKSKTMQLYLSDLLAKRLIDKKYVAIVENGQNLPEVLNMPIADKSAYTRVLAKYPLETKDALCLVVLLLETGRTHQIRIHCKKYGSPLVGDTIYNQGGVTLGRGLFLQAYAMRWKSPDGRERIVKIPLHKKFLKYTRNIKID